MLKKKYLEYLGLSEKEAEIYIELLRRDTASGIELCRSTNIKKATVYVVIDSLLKKGLVKEIGVGKRIHYHAETPDKFKEIYEKERLELETKLEDLNKIILELKSVDKRPGQRPVIRHYEGRQAVVDAIDQYVRQQDYSPGLDYGVYSYSLMKEIFRQKDIDEITKKRIENNIKFRAIYTGPETHFETDKNKELIKIDQEQFPIECDISIFRDEVRFHTLGKDIFGISIKNKEIATTLKSLIDYVFSSKK